MMKRVEEMSGRGRLECGGAVYPGVRYDVARYQGYSPAGLPVPGRFRLDGSIDAAVLGDAAERVGSSVTLGLDDGRSLRLTLVDSDGGVLAEGHGPSRCGCC